MRRTRALVLSLAVVAGTLTGACSGDNPYEAGKAAQTAPASTTVDDDLSTVSTVSTTGQEGGQDDGQDDGQDENVYLPEDQDVTDCVGTVELPNCGSKEKGGWRMYLVMAVLVAGVAFIAWRVARLVRRRDAIVNAADVDADE